MSARHITCRDNVDDDGFLIDPEVVHHGAVEKGILSHLGGPVDPATHINIDFAEHELGVCGVAETLEVGSSFVRNEDGTVMTAEARPGHKKRLGRVDLGARRVEWLQAVHALRDSQ